MHFVASFIEIVSLGLGARVIVVDAINMINCNFFAALLLETSSIALKVLKVLYLYLRGFVTGCIFNNFHQL